MRDRPKGWGAGSEAREATAGECAIRVRIPAQNETWPSGGIGRRACLKSKYPQGCGGSSPS